MILSFEACKDLFMRVIPQAERKNDQTYLGRCIKCGDSKKDPQKKRLYLVAPAGQYPSMIKCHNCFFSRPADLFFKEEFNQEVEELKKCYNSDEEMQKLFTTVEKFIPKSQEENYKDFLEEVVHAKKIVCNFFRKCTESVEKNEVALKYVKGRFLPPEVINKIRVLKDEFVRKDFRYSYLKDYILFPFIDSSDRLPYYFHARRYNKLENERMARYLSCPYRTNNGVSFYLNELNVDKDFPIFVCEGTIDSFHLPNSMSVNGVNKISNDFLSKMEYRFGKKNLVFCLDNEMIDVEARKRAKFLYNKGYYIFAWSKMVKAHPVVRDIKDFNSLCVKSQRTTIPFEVLSKFIVKKD